MGFALLSLAERIINAAAFGHASHHVQGFGEKGPAQSMYTYLRAQSCSRWEQACASLGLVTALESVVWSGLHHFRTGTGQGGDHADCSQGTRNLRFKPFSSSHPLHHGAICGLPNVIDGEQWPSSPPIPIPLKRMRHQVSSSTSQQTPGKDVGAADWHSKRHRQLPLLAHCAVQLGLGFTGLLGASDAGASGRKM